MPCSSTLQSILASIATLRETNPNALIRLNLEGFSLGCSVVTATANVLTDILRRDFLQVKSTRSIPKLLKLPKARRPPNVVLKSLVLLSPFYDIASMANHFINVSIKRCPFRHVWVSNSLNLRAISEAIFRSKTAPLLGFVIILVHQWRDRLEYRS